MSHKGTIPVDSDKDTIACCLDAVDRCDFFLGIITGTYGTTVRDGVSATHLEFRRAIEKKKLRWFIVDDKVIFARNMLRRLYSDKDFKHSVKRDALHYKGMGFAQFSDLRLIDLYEEACRPDDKAKKVNWVQTFYDDASGLLFAYAQFSRYLELEELIRKRLSDRSAIEERVGGNSKGVSDV